VTPERRLHLIEGPVVLEWTEHAACAGANVDLFFPQKRPTVRPSRQVLESKRICAACPVRPQCLEYALERPEPEGTWGGLTEWERRDLRRATG
jgi:WhiB family redox-sensing transcriptional regulator